MPAIGTWRRGPSSGWGRHISREYRINDRIRAREVRLIGENGEQLGTLPLFKALETAREQGLDLVEVAPAANPPVCRLIDYGKFKYEQSKKDREAKKHQKNVQLREIRMSAKTDDHDVDFKTRIAERLLKDGDKVKVTIRFRGREITHPNLGRDLLDQIFGKLKLVGSIEKPPGMEGRTMTMILVPGAAKPEKAPRPPVAVGAAAPGPASAPVESPAAAAVSEPADAPEPAATASGPAAPASPAPTPEP